MSDFVRSGWIVYFNGIEIPAASCNIVSGVWQVPQATITIPADRLMQRVGVDDRVRVLILAIDPYRSTQHPEEGSPFRVAFEGEILSFSYSSTNQGRSLSFVAADMIKVLNDILPHFITSLDSITIGQTSTDAAAQSGVANPFAPQHALLTAGLNGSGNIKRPYDLVDNILRLLLDDTILTNDRSVVMTEWFKPWNERTKFSDRFVPSAYVEAFSETGEVPAFPILRAAQNTEALNALASSASQLGISGSMYNMLQTIFQHVYYELAMIPNPPYLAVNKKTREIVGDFNAQVGEIAPVALQTTQGSTVDLASLQVELAQEEERLKEVQQAYTDADPAIVASYEAQVALVRALQLDVTNYKVRGGDYSDFQQPVVEADNELKAARNALRVLKEKEKDPTVGTDGGAVNFSNQTQIAQAIAKVEARIRELEAKKDASVVQAKFLTSNAQGSKHVIASYMTKPHMMFGVAPSFNVLWPSMYEQFSYDESYANQPTRTYIGNPHIYNMQENPGAAVGPSELAMRALTVGYPPEANQRLIDKQTKSNLNQHNFLVRYEEYFKGPVYHQETTPPWFHMLTNRGTAESSPENLLRLYARYEHQRVRASMRNGGVVGPYNPNVVAGFPGVVLDNEQSNVHVFAYFTRVTQSFTQTSMSTNISFTHAQTFGEFFGTLSDQYFQDTITEITPTTPSSVPQHPIAELRDRFQVNNAAREYYQAMFWGSIGESIKEAVIFDIFDVLAVKDNDGNTVPIGFTGAPTFAPASKRSPEEIKADQEVVGTALTVLLDALQRVDTFDITQSSNIRVAYDAKAAELLVLNRELAQANARDAAITERSARSTSGQPVLNGTPNEKTGEPPEYVVKPAYARLMHDSLKAFAFGTRPICTLEQYITSLGDRGARDGYRLPSNKLEGKGAPYYVKIFNINNEPITPVTLGTDGLPCGTIGTDVRRNWEARFLAFRRKVYTSQQPFKA